jgi:UPF0755 protein
VGAPPQDNEPAPAAAPAAGQGKKKKRVFNDPVQNTKRDPLLNKTFDLNSPQTVPKLN